MIQNRAYRGTMGGSIDYKDTLARIMQRLRTRLRFRPDLSRDYRSPNPDSPEYAGLEGATLVVLEQLPTRDHTRAPDEPEESNSQD